MGDGGRCHVQRLGDLAHAPLLVKQGEQDAEPCRIPEDPVQICKV